MLVVQCEAAMGAASTLRLSLLYRMLRAGELLALLAFVSWSTSHVPSVVAAAMRLAGSLLLNARFVFVLGNAIVLLLYALSRHDDVSSSSSNNDQQQQPAASTTTSTATSTAPQHQQQPVDDSVSSFPSFTTTPTTTHQPPVATPADPLLPSSAGSRDQATRAVPAPEPDPLLVPRRASATAAVSPPSFADKQMPQQQPAVRVSKARAPRRSRSEKMGGGPRMVLGRAASPELRRCESENGRRRRSSVTAREAEACWGREDADELRRKVEAFIARQTRFHREESMSMSVAMAGGGGQQHCEAAPAFTGALTVVE